MAGVEVEGGGPRIGDGARGRVRTPVGVWVPFEVTEWVAGERWAWRVGGVPATTHGVRALDGGRSEVVLGVPWWAPAYLAVCAVAVRRIGALAVERADGPVG